MKWLIKLICPSGETLAGYAAEGIAKSVNSSSDDVRDKIAKYSAYANEATRIANTLTGMVVDGKLDKADVEALQEMITPLFDKLLALV